MINSAPYPLIRQGSEKSARMCGGMVAFACRLPFARSLLLIAPLLFLAQTTFLRAQPVAPLVPAIWWTESGLINAGSPGNSSPLAVGQLKNTVWNLAKVLDARYPAQGGCGDDLRALMRTWDTNFPATASTVPHTPAIVQDGAMLAVANQGQLKQVSLLAYRRLKALGLPIVLKDRDVSTQEIKSFVVDPDTIQVPWTHGQNRVPALLGHLKYCFSFEIPEAGVGVGVGVGVGRVLAFGSNTGGQSTVPAGLDDVVAVAAGSAHSLALNRDGTVAAWGANGSGQATVPAGLSSVTAIAAGASHNLALKTDGTVVAWGRNESGQTAVPAGLGGVVAISAGYYHSLALKRDGTVVAWGALNYNGPYYYSYIRADYGQARVPAGLMGVVAISAGIYHSLAMKADGTVIAWGASSDPNSSQYSYYSSSTSPPGQYVNRFPDNMARGQTTIPAGLRATSVAAKFLTSFAVRADGSVLTWGTGESPTTATGVVKVATYLTNEQMLGGYDYFLLHENGTLTSWYSTGDPVAEMPEGMAGLTGVKDVSVGAGHILVIQGMPSTPGASTFAPVWVSPSWSVGPEAGSITGTYYRAQVQHGPVTYTAEGLPPGLSIDGATGIISGTPTTAAYDEAQITATNAFGATNISVRFHLENLLPQIVTTEIPRAYISSHYSHQFTFQQVLDNAITGSSITGLPSGLTYDPSTRTISGTPTQVGRFDTTLSVESPLGARQLTWVFSISTVAAWGSNSEGQINVPAGLGDVRDLALGGSHSLALKNDGTVIGWGYNHYGQATPPAGLTGVAAIAAGHYHSVALKQDGTLVIWGNNDYSQFYVPAGLSDVVVIAVYGHRNVALKGDGTVVSWGPNTSGVNAPPSGLTNVIAIATGNEHSLALRSDGTVVAWGSNEHGRSTVPVGLNGVVAIAAGSSHSLALKSDGTVVAWGYNYNGQATVPAGLSGVTTIAGRHSGSFALKSDGTLASWGYTEETSMPAGLSGIVAIAGGNSHSAAIVSASPAFTSSASFNMSVDPATLTGTYYRSTLSHGFGAAAYSASGLPPGLSIDPVTGIVSGTPQQAGDWTATLTATTASGAATQQVRFRLNDLIPQIDNAITENHYIFRPFSKTLITRYATTTSVTGLPPGIQYDPVTQTMTGTPTQIGTFQAIATATNALGSSSTQITFTIRNIWAWGYSNNGEAAVPASLLRARAIFAGYSHSFAINGDTNTLLAWGLGDNGRTAIPAGLTSDNIIDLQSASDHNLALKNDGTIIGWGSNSYGKATPPVGLTNVTAISVGSFHSAALRSNGTVTVWGYYDNRLATPAGLNSIIDIASGSDHCLALKNDGTVVAWGSNINGQTTVPAGLTGVVAIAGGGSHSLALKNDGTVVAWGSNSNGQSTVPAGLAGVVAIAAGGSHSLALKNDGTLVGWGADSNGQRSIPTGMHGVIAVTAGGGFSLIMQAPDGQPVFVSPAISTGPEDSSSPTGIYYRAHVVNGSGVTYTAAGLPPGLDLDPATGIISGTPTAPADPASYPPGYPAGYGNTVTVTVIASITATSPAGTATKNVGFRYPVTVP